MPNDEWQTPSHIIEIAREVMGNIDLDPASSESAQARVKAGYWYDKHSSGLEHTWDGYDNVWLNPPYSTKLLSAFVLKLLDHCKDRERQAVVLVNNNTETHTFQRLLFAASAVCFPERRICFILNGSEGASPRQGQAIFYFGRNQLKFCLHFAEIGTAIPLNLSTKNC